MRRRRNSLPADRELAPTVALFAALANATRLELLVALARLGPLSAGELQDIVGKEQSAVSHQLATLRRRHLVAAERQGKQVIYRLLDDHVAHIVEDALKHANESR